jgi:beta-N-acetylhexosaminidase
MKKRFRQGLAKKGLLFLFLFLALGGLFILRFSSKWSVPKESQETGQQRRLEEKIKLMSLDQKIGQLLFFGGDFQNLAEDDWRLLSGGIIINQKSIPPWRDKNQKLLREEIIQLQEKVASQSGIQPFFGVDQEGGEVCRLEWLNCTSQKMISDKKQAMMLGRTRGEELKKLGINLVFAPVLDISKNRADFIWGRTFNTDSPQEVSSLGLAMIGGFNQAGLISCPKHFPGHGGTEIDSHWQLPTLDCDQKCLDDSLYPFKKAIDNGVKMIMVGHIKISNIKYQKSKIIDKEMPASLSKYWIDEVLRGQLGFTGVVVTDDLLMRSLGQVDYQDMEGIDRSQDFWWVSAAAVEAIKAGADMVMISDNPKIQNQVFERLKKMLETGEISEKRLNESLKKILRLKFQY